MKTLLIQVINLKKALLPADYYSPNERRTALEKALAILLQSSINEAQSKAKTLQKNLLKHQQNYPDFFMVCRCAT